MITRLWWFALGFLSGIVATIWSWHWVRRTVRRYVPEQVRADASDRWRSVGRDLRAAVAEGREEAASTEARLRSTYGPGTAA